jgi:biopolymer transport protein ExbD
MRVNRGSPRRARIEILPLIDIVFLLLVFFIYAMLSMAVHRGVAVNLPTSATAGMEKDLSLSVTVRENRQILLDTHRVSLRDLAGLLRVKAQECRSSQVHLFADKEVSYQLLIKVLDQIRAAGLSNVVLQTTKEIQP